MNNASLHNRVRKSASDRLWQPGKTVTAQDENVTQTPITQLSEHRMPKLRPLGLSDPHTQSVLAPVDVHAHGQVRDLDRDRTLVPDLDPQPIDVDDRFSWGRWPVV